MRIPRILEEMRRHRWAITQEAFDALRSVLDGYELSAEDYRYFHALEQERKAELAATFGRRVDGAQYASVKDNVGFLLFDGPIIPRATWFSQVSGMVSLDTMTNEFKALEANDRVDTIVQLFDTPGGAVSGVSDYAAMVRASDKSTYSFAWMAASAGLWIASAARDGLILSESGMAGSIGVVLSLTDTSKADEKRGVRQLEIVSSQSPDKRPNIETQEGLSVYQKEVDDLADVFIQTVADNRGTSVETVLSDFGHGAMLVGAHAVDVGLADRVSDIESFVKGITSQKRAFFGYSSPAATVGVTVEGRQMTTNTQNPTAEQLREQHPSAVETIEMDAVTRGAAKERARFRAIGKLADRFQAAHPAVRAAAAKAVAHCQYETDEEGNSYTEASAALAVLDAVARAQTEALVSAAAPRQDMALAAEHASTAQTNIATSADSNAADASARRIAKLKAAQARIEGKAV